MEENQPPRERKPMTFDPTGRSGKPKQGFTFNPNPQRPLPGYQPHQKPPQQTGVQQQILAELKQINDKLSRILENFGPIG